MRPRIRMMFAHPSRVAAFAFALALVALAPRLYAQIRVAVVDIQRAARETDQGQAANQVLHTLFEKNQQDIDGRQRALKQLRDDLEKGRSTLPQEELERRMNDYQRQFVDMQDTYVRYQQELAQREAELTKQIFVNLRAVIRQVGQDENFTVIFERQGVVWSPEQLDLTERVVQLYNQQFPPESAPSSDATGGEGAPGSGSGTGGRGSSSSGPGRSVGGAGTGPRSQGNTGGSRAGGTSPR